MEKRKKWPIVFGEAFVLTWFLYSPVLALADAIHLANGDILTGELIRMEKNTLIFKTPYAGEICILWTEIACLQSEKEYEVRLKSQEKI